VLGLRVPNPQPARGLSMNSNTESFTVSAERLYTMVWMAVERVFLAHIDERPDVMAELEWLDDYAPDSLEQLSDSVDRLIIDACADCGNPTPRLAWTEAEPKLLALVLDRITLLGQELRALHGLSTVRLSIRPEVLVLHLLLRRPLSSFLLS